jgi:hypothetical protein
MGRMAVISTGGNAYVHLRERQTASLRAKEGLRFPENEQDEEPTQS